LKKFSYEDHILFAEVNDPFDEVAVLPGIVCRELKPGGKVRAKYKKGATPSPKTNEGKEMDDESGSDKERKVARKQRLFYIKSNKLGITNITNTAYEGKPLCVVAQAKDTLKDAILKDGRFCEEFTLFEDNGHLSDVPLNYHVSKCSRQIFIMKKRPKKRKKSDDKPSSNEECSTNKSKKSVYSSIPTSITESFTEEIGKTMIEDARNSASVTLFKPGVQKGRLDKKMQSITRKFGKVASSVIPARIMPKLTKARRSVGFIKCGNCTGTCFLLAENTIITCHHVINDIYTKRSQATDKELYKTISVNFRFERPRESEMCHAVIDETQMFGQGKLDYVICVIKMLVPVPGPTPVPLGPSVKSVLPHSGLVILIGHPDSQDKSVEICHILPSYNWHSTLCKRASEAEQYCKQHPEECHSFNNKDESCVHFYKGRYLQGDHPNHLPYDTSFFKGSSGSPVFNSDGHIVAMHTQGYPFYQGSKKVSLMEFGVTFGAIYQDVKERFGLDQASLLFPEINS
jgi:hypothetical protein